MITNFLIYAYNLTIFQVIIILKNVTLNIIIYSITTAIDCATTHKVRSFKFIFLWLYFIIYTSLFNQNLLYRWINFIIILKLIESTEKRYILYYTLRLLPSSFANWVAWFIFQLIGCLVDLWSPNWFRLSVFWHHCHIQPGIIL